VDLPISYLTPIVAACAVVAWALAFFRRLPGHLAVGAVLTWWYAYTFLRGAIDVAVLAPERSRIGGLAPFTGTALLWYYAEVALRLTWPFAILAACRRVFQRRSVWWVAPLWALVAACLCWLYPELRRRPQSIVEGLVGFACWSASAWASWHGHRALRVDPPEAYIPFALILGAQLAVIVIVQLAGEQQHDWSIARVIQGVAYSALLCYQAVKLCRPTWGT
jgi:hypothetical protein